MSKASTKSKVRPISPDEAKLMIDKLDAAIKDYSGTFDELEQAVGMYVLGRHVGWKPLVLIHHKRTIRKYEKILKINIREEFDEEGPDAERSLGYRFARTLSNFWKAVSGEEQVPDRRTIA